VRFRLNTGWTHLRNNQSSFPFSSPDSDAGVDSLTDKEGKTEGSNYPISLPVGREIFSSFSKG